MCEQPSVPPGEAYVAVWTVCNERVHAGCIRCQETHFVLFIYFPFEMLQHNDPMQVRGSQFRHEGLVCTENQEGQGDQPGELLKRVSVLKQTMIHFRQGTHTSWASTVCVCEG
jgi:hypothetical protein